MEKPQRRRRGCAAATRRDARTCTLILFAARKRLVCPGLDDVPGGLKHLVEQAQDLRLVVDHENAPRFLGAATGVFSRSLLAHARLDTVSRLRFLS